MKTTLYIDGYNLYYGVLRNIPYKWLDIAKLFSRLTKERSLDAEIISIKFFTAPVKIRFATHSEESQKSQRDYHRTLEKLYPNLSIIYGYFNPTEGWYPKYQTPVDRSDTIRAWNLEEKQTDVNIALHMYRDIAKGTTDQCVLVSNDSDLIPALAIIKEDFPEAIIGSVMPIKKRTNVSERPPNAGILKYSDWARGYITEDELKDSQLPKMIPTKKKPIYKPSYW